MAFNASYIGMREDIVKMVAGNNLSILDIGCANGATGRFLLEQQRALRVVGVEYIPEMAQAAEQNLSAVICGSIEDETTWAAIAEQTNGAYDYIFFGDVLEHLHDPWTVLRRAATWLKPGGKVIISLPNFQHIDVFIHIFIKGTFARNDRGIFDKTHLRFFTLRNMHELAEAADLKITKYNRIFRYRDRLGSRFLPIYGHFLKAIFPNYYTFQYILVAEKK